jgi:hypothetical protein
MPMPHAVRQSEDQLPRPSDMFMFYIQKHQMLSKQNKRPVAKFQVPSVQSMVQMTLNKESSKPKKEVITRKIVSRSTES